MVNIYYEYRVEFNFKGNDYILVYETTEDERENLPMVCVEKTSGQIVPFEKKSFATQQEIIDYIYSVL